MIKKRLLVSLIFAIIAFIGIRVAIFYKLDLWFLLLNKPLLMPPNEAFIPIWIITFVLIALAGWLFWIYAEKSQRFPGLIWYLIQFILNCLWFYLFFGLHRLDLAFLDTLLLTLVIAKTLRCFWPVSRIAGGLLIPYLIAAIFASYVTGMIWWLN